MPVKRIIITFLFVFPICFLLQSRSQTPADSGIVYMPYSSSKIIIDGNTDDWTIYSSSSFSDTAGILHSPEEWSFEKTYDGLNPRNILLPKSYKVTVKYCWNMNGLYFAFRVEDKNLMAEISRGEDNPVIFLNDGIEIYIDSRFDSKTKMDINDYQFMIDILSNTTVFKGDRKLQDSIKYSVPKDYGLNIMIEKKISFAGYLNDTLSADSGFTAEVRIPFEAIGIFAEPGKKLKIDLCNNDNDYLLSRYNITDTFSVITRPFNWSGLNNFGYPDYWKVCELTGEPGWFEKMSSGQKKTWIITFLVITVLSLGVMALLIHRINRLRRIPSQSEVKPAKLVFIKQSQDQIPHESVNQRYLQKASEFISDKYSENLNSEDVAKQIGLSLRKFQRITKEELNCTPTNFMYLVKLNKAADYIRNNHGNISEIAYQFGFSSPSYFSKMFKSHFGVSPVEYKNSDNSLNENVSKH
jgi:AraC-like DNA-binding protein